jgi:hypothetical protein
VKVLLARIPQGQALPTEAELGALVGKPVTAPGARVSAVGTVTGTELSGRELYATLELSHPEVASAILGATIPASIEGVG